uniref:Transmembrane protein 138 n=1 Tax=Strongyloides stercoralis TaxID=6248 RepID=A0A0K0DV17_STRER
MNPNNNFKTFSISVEKIVFIFCILEMSLIIYFYQSDIYHPLANCQKVNATDVEEIYTGRGPGKMITVEKEICTTNIFVNFFVIAHFAADVLCLCSFPTYRATLIFPLLIILIANIFSSTIFLIFNLGYVVFKEKHEWFTSIFILLQLFLRLYQFTVARRYYWYKSWQDENKHVPVNNLLTEDDYPFQF